MRKSIIFGLAALSSAFLFSADNSYADRDATPYEAAAVYGALKTQGCTVADDVEVEPFAGMYRGTGAYRYGESGYMVPGIYTTEAICDDGERYDIKMDSQLNIISMKVD